MNIIIDTGPLVAFLNQDDQYHEWIKEQLGNTIPPLLTCEAVLSEAAFLLKNISRGREILLECLHRQFVRIAFSLQQEVEAVKALIARYKNVPMSLADACLVRMSEQYFNSKILTLDRDFEIYRKHNRTVIPLLIPA